MPSPSIQIKAGNPKIIAPCGIDCSLCMFYLRARRPCPGCREANNDKANACITCAMKNCEELSAGGYKYCSSCAKFPPVLVYVTLTAGTGQGTE